jgi:hypothetical protein
MSEVNTTIAIIPSSQFKWTFQVQYKESLSTRDEAIHYASRNNCNLIVQYSKRSGPQFDVLHDPELVCTSGVRCEPVETVQVVAQPESVGWSKLLFRGAFRLAKRMATGVKNSHHENAMPAVPSQALAAKS